ncbi:MAG: S41 family peptidase [Bacillota bacterium]|nr:S41 family peptidase [Bacillota bacterium]
MRSTRGRGVALALVLLTVVASLGLIVQGSRVASGQGEVGGGPGEAAFRQAVALVQGLALRPVPVERLWRGALEGMVRALGDQYSAYLSPEAVKAFVQGVDRTFEGIGVTIEVRDSYVTVVSPIPGSPAERVGLRSGDRILKVDGESVSGLVLEEVGSRIRGPAGTKVVLEVARPGTEGAFQVVVERAQVSLPSVEWRPLGNGVGYIRVVQFSSGSGRDFGEALAALRRDHRVRGLVLDLRDNAGGIVGEASEVASLLVPSGPIALLVQRIEGDRVLRVDGSGPSLPVAVLVNGGTASAAELLAGAIRDRGLGVLVGSRTFGKGTMQGLYPLPDGGALRLTVAAYLTPGGHYIEGQGLRPDIEIPEESTRFPRNQALNWQRVLKRGAIGLDVLSLQEALEELGFDCGEPDGIFGPRTERAVRAFQAGRGMRPTGVVDEATLREIGRPPAPNGPDVALARAKEWVLDRLGGAR